MVRRLWTRVRPLVRRGDFEDGMAAEVRVHLELYTAELIQSGVTPSEAARRARQEFGNLDNVKVDCRDARGLAGVDEVIRNLRFAVRRLLKTPGVTASAIATLALCLGSTLSVFGVVDSILLRPLPFSDPDRLVTVYNTYPKAGVLNDGCSLTNYYERRGQVAAFSSIAVYRDGTALVGDAGSTEREPVIRVSPEFFATLGRLPVRGRAFLEQEVRGEASRVAIVTDGYWRDRLSSDPHVIGRAIRVDGGARIIVGVLPADFGFLSSPARIYLPLTADPSEWAPTRRHSGNAEMVGRLAPGVTIADAQSQLDAHNAAMEAGSTFAQQMADAGFRSVVVAMHADHVATIRPTLMLLQAGALVLLAIGAVNVSNLLLIRASGRTRELAVRMAIGATRRHILHETLAETILLTAAGGIAGLIVAGAGIGLLDRLGADHLPLGARIAFDARLALAGVAGAVALGAALGVPLAWSQLHARTTVVLQSESRGSTGGRLVHRVRHGFVVAQVALAFVLLAGAGLLAMSLKAATEVSPGFQPDRVLTVQTTLPASRYRDAAALVTASHRLVDALEALPGIHAAGISTNVPLSGTSNKSAVTVKPPVEPSGEMTQGHYAYSVDGHYLRAMGHEIVEGRLLDADDSVRHERPVVVDDDFARRYFGGGSALGRRVFEGPQQGGDADAYTIVGVVRAARQSSLTEANGQGAIYYPYGRRPDREVYITIKTAQDPELAAPLVRETLRAIDTELPVSAVKTMETRVADSLVGLRSPTVLAALFSAVAVMLAAIGTYGVLSHAVSSRRREIGIRMALGARPDQIVGHIMAVGARLLITGVILGLAGAILSGPAIESVLFNVPAMHVAVLAVTTLVIVLVSLAGCLLPARRAMRVSPLTAIAHD